MIRNQSQKIELLGQAPVRRALLAMGLPTMIGMVIMALYNLADAYFVAGLGTGPMGAISVLFPLSQIVVGVALLFGTGAASFIARLLGRDDATHANQVASTALYGAMATGALVIILTMFGMTNVLRLCGATDGIMPYAVTYTAIYLPFAIFGIFNVTMNNIATSEGATRVSMLGMMAGAIANIILDPILIYWADMGIAGAAIATAIGMMMSSAIYLHYIFSRKSIFTFRIRDCRFNRENMVEILKIGIPTLLTNVLTATSVTLTNRAAAPFGDVAIAAMGTAMRILAIGALMVFGFIKGFQPIAGFSYGARNFDRLRDVTRTAIWWTTTFCAIIGAFLIALRTPIMAQFAAGNMEMMNIGRTALTAHSAALVTFGFYTVCSCLFLALGRARAGLFLGICRQGICLIPAIIIMPTIWGLNGVLYAQPVADVIASIIAAVMTLRLQRDIRSMRDGAAQKKL